MKLTKITQGYADATSIGHAWFDDGSYGCWQISRCTGEIGLQLSLTPLVDGSPSRYVTHGTRLRLVTRTLLRRHATGILSHEDFVHPDRFEIGEAA